MKIIQFQFPFPREGWYAELNVKINRVQTLHTATGKFNDSIIISIWWKTKKFVKGWIYAFNLRVRAFNLFQWNGFPHPFFKCIMWMDTQIKGNSGIWELLTNCFSLLGTLFQRPITCFLGFSWFLKLRDASFYLSFRLLSYILCTVPAFPTNHGHSA